MLQLNFKSISEAKPGEKWQSLFNTHWPAYKAWFISKGAVNKPGLVVSRSKFKEYMPEMVPTYDRLCQLAGGDMIAERFLTGYQPPAYITGCSQAIWQEGPLLVRNYDYHPNLSEGTLLHSQWNGKEVIATGDCLWGAVDGMNGDGLAVSLTFGGRKDVGKGFGIPFILRYVLEFADDVLQAVEILKSIPTHMAYNVAILDKTGSFKTVQLAPDHEPVITETAVSTNHQGEIDWPEHARFSKTLKREKFLKDKLSLGVRNDEDLIHTFLEQPLFNRQYRDGFGTLYTAAYKPADGTMSLRWENEELHQSFKDFIEGNKNIQYTEVVPTAVPYYAEPVHVETSYSDGGFAPSTEADQWAKYGEAWATDTPGGLAKYITKTIADAMKSAGYMNVEEKLEPLNKETKKRGQIPWEMLADVWADFNFGEWR